MPSSGICTSTDRTPFSAFRPLSLNAHYLEFRRVEATIRSDVVATRLTNPNARRLRRDQLDVGRRRSAKVAAASTAAQRDPVDAEEQPLGSEMRAWNRQIGTRSTRYSIVAASNRAGSVTEPLVSDAASPGRSGIVRSTTTVSGPLTAVFPAPSIRRTLY